ncbi:MAG: dephospho-CoA kinase [Bacillota bacterium]|nr:dephospho-CoA kinase [Bacillota bacterium]
MLIGLTGGIGSGKSTVSGYLEKKGITVVDADKISRLVVKPGSEALGEIKDVFGAEYILPDGNLDRKRLGRLVFSDKTALWKLNYIMSNRIGMEIDRQIKASETEITVLDAATLIESGYDALVDVLWIVDADDEVRIKRVMERDSASRQEVLDRMANQMSRQERLARECTVIDNSGTIEETWANVQRALDEL